MTNSKQKVAQLSGCDHVQIIGQAFYNDNRSFFFAPNDPMPELLKSFRRKGTAQQMSDGTFDFVADPDRRSKSKLIKKLAHGRLSETQDGYIRLTLRFRIEDNEDVAGRMVFETLEATDALRSYSNL